MKETFNILQITISDVWRGHEQQILYYAEEFEKMGNKQVFVCAEGTPVHERAKKEGINVIGVPSKSKYDLSFAKKLKQIAEENNIDVILIHNTGAQTACILSSLIYGLKTPMVLFRTLIEKVDTNFFRRWKYNFKGIKKVVCVSQAVKDILGSAIDDYSRFDIVSTATDVDNFKDSKKTDLLHKELGLDTSIKLVGNISAFVDFKDYYTFIDTCKILSEKRNDIRFVSVGIGPLMDKIKQYAKEKEVYDKIYFLGFREDIPKVLPCFDIFLFTSNLEPTGGVLLEANLCNVPIVTTNGGGIGDMVVHEETALLYPIKSPEKMAKGVLYLLDNPAKGEEFSRNGKERINKYFTKEIIASNMFRVLKEVVNS